MKKTIARFVLVVMALGTLGTALLLWRVQPAKAQGDTLPPRLGFSRYTIGLTRGFSAKLTVVNTSGVVGYPPDPCMVQMLLQPPDPGTWVSPKEETTIFPGGMVSQTLNGNDIIPSTAPFGTRKEVAAVVKVMTSGFPPDPCRATLQIFNNPSGITTAVLSHSPDPQ